MVNLIKVNMECVESELEKLFEGYITSESWELESIEAVDSCEFVCYEGEPDTEYEICFTVKGHEKHINKRTGEESDEWITLERKYMQYDFNKEILYGFFEVVSTSCCEATKDWKFAEHMSKKSRTRR